MPYRKIPLVSQEIYHIFNRSIAKQPIFLDRRDYQRIIELINFYRYQNLPLRFSHYKRLDTDKRQKLLAEIQKTLKPRVEILAFCIMPNHIHLLLKAVADNAITKFMSDIQNSYSKYFNLKYDRTGSLFQSMFKAVRIETDEQLIHVSRYIHLNPVTSYIINFNSLKDYSWSSFQLYLSGQPDSLINTIPVMEHFKNKEDYRIFTENQVEYQRELDKIKHLVIDP